MASTATKQSSDASDKCAMDSTSRVVSPHDIAVKRINEQLHEIQQREPILSYSESGSGSKDGQDSKVKRPQEPLMDPFDGQNIGYLAPGEMDKVEDGIWTHLARIRDLQSEIAKSHSYMEGLGEGKNSHKAEPSADDETINVDEEAKAVKSAEIQKLSGSFKGRKETIDEIMSKLASLSHAINDFHSAREPVFPSVSTQTDPQSSS